MTEEAEVVLEGVDEAGEEAVGTCENESTKKVKVRTRRDEEEQVEETYLPAADEGRSSLSV